MPLGTVGRYQLIRKVAQGGMAEVFLAKSYGAHGFEKPVAIKRILGRYAADEQFVTMLIDEARITSQLNHPNIVPVLDFHADAQDCYLVMEYVAGRSLSNLTRCLLTDGRTLPVEHLLFICKECAAGLHHAHVKTDKTGRPLHIVHRDVSPQNVLVSFDGFVKIIDFGIARARDRLAQTEVGTIKGKVRYLAPEQLHGEGVDGRTDMFSLAIVMWEALTNCTLFDGASDLEVCDQIMRTEIPDPRTYNKDVPEELVRVLNRALARQKEQRFSSCEAFSAELRGILTRANPDYDPSTLGALMRSQFRLEMDEDLAEEAREEAELARANAAAAAPYVEHANRASRPPAPMEEPSGPADDAVDAELSPAPKAGDEPEAAKLRRRSSAKGKRAAQARREAQNEVPVDEATLQPVPPAVNKVAELLEDCSDDTHVDASAPPAPPALRPAVSLTDLTSLPPPPRSFEDTEDQGSFRRLTTLFTRSNPHHTLVWTVAAGAVAGVLIAVVAATLLHGSPAPRSVQLVESAEGTPGLEEAPEVASADEQDAQARLLLVAEPENARLWVDGRWVLHNNRQVGLSAGEHRLKITARGHLDEERVVDVAPGDNLYLAVKLIRHARKPAINDERRPIHLTAHARMNLSSVGEPAIITVNGRMLPARTPLTLTVVPGDYQVVLTQPQTRQSQVFQVQLASNEHKDVIANFPPSAQP